MMHSVIDDSPVQAREFGTMESVRFGVRVTDGRLNRWSYYRGDCLAILQRAMDRGSYVCRDGNYLSKSYK